MKRLWICLTLFLCIPGISYAQGLGFGKGVGGVRLDRQPLALRMGARRYQA